MNTEYAKMIKKDVSWFAGMCMIYAVVSIVIVILYALFAIMLAVSENMDNASKITETAIRIIGQRMGLVYLIAAPIGVLLFSIYRKGALFKSDIRHKGQKMTLPALGFFILCLFLSQLVFYIVNSWLADYLTLLGIPIKDSMSSISGPTTWELFIYVNLAAPISEELIFRGAGLRALEKYGKVFAILMSSLFFGFFHGNLNQIPFAIFIGLFLGYVALEYSIFWSIFLHIFNNLVIGDGLTYLYSHLTSQQVNWIHPILLLLLAGPALFILYKKRQQISNYLQANKVYPGTFGQAFRAPVFWIFIILEIINALIILS
ncbi:CPBP family intramembrane glutamic endopeptidase [Streptococcus oricebi]|uniref:CPBP family intramembrane metalloprotease domain-containing protein n=1 Tax=Streptococcus oricebi TaxID=1547447 RepID=A0ABS5B0L7_9STRE|nr:type II CAAX endopeptidase family protein [Streptococcus oricebi]MBP2622372.1 CPBP family intramembrane metalloprotease domain-containing protein [Streptococcus oricebi]